MTAETAVLLPGLAAVLVVVVSVLGSGLDQVRVTEATRSAARLLARGEPAASVRSSALASAPPGSSFAVRTRDGQVVVTIVAPGRRALPWLPLPDVAATATVAVEWDAAVRW
ncbi:MAG: chromosome partitioning protein [Actinomycetota bacterium]|nr:chromosome partitioning protein [Actinomycetota bacterium]